MEKDQFLLWQMEPGIGLEANIMLAMERYARKSGLQADVVQVNEADLAVHAIEAVGFNIQADITVEKGTMFVGRKANE